MLVVLRVAAPSRAAEGVSETRAVAGFERIRLQGVFTATITAGAPQTHVVVRGDRAAV
ncbi:MAG: hypothetical protein IAI49_12135, partial [Candidatus Eremiobacteraeota bacterium]|nr:hypothetical protein [Candidatus Eremiobacteraeota bacterium]